MPIAFFRAPRSHNDNRGRGKVHQILGHPMKEQIKMFSRIIRIRLEGIEPKCSLTTQQYRQLCQDAIPPLQRLHSVPEAHCVDISFLRSILHRGWEKLGINTTHLDSFRIPFRPPKERSQFGLVPHPTDRREPLKPLEKIPHRTHHMLHLQ